MFIVMLNTAAPICRRVVARTFRKHLHKPEER